MIQFFRQNEWHYYQHYSDVIMSAMMSQITGISLVCSTDSLGACQRKHQSSSSPAFVTKGQNRDRCFHLMTSSWNFNDDVIPKCLSVAASCHMIALLRCVKIKQYERDKFLYENIVLVDVIMDEHAIGDVNSQPECTVFAETYVFAHYYRCKIIPTHAGSCCCEWCLFTFTCNKIRLYVTNQIYIYIRVTAIFVHNVILTLWCLFFMIL